MTMTLQSQLQIFCLQIKVIGMCDSEITVSCPSDFTSYCPADSLCTADIRPHKKIRPRSKVRSRVVWFTRKASYPSRQGISSQLRIKPLGETQCKDDEQLDLINEESRCPDWSSDSSSADEEEHTGLKNDTWLHEQPPCYVSREEFDALKGCVMRGRALFSPRPSKNTLANQATASDDSSHASITESELCIPPSALLVPSEGHDRQGSFEYDHLEDFDTQHNTAVNEIPSVATAGQSVSQLDTCSVSIQFGATGYECQAICEAECGNADHTLHPPAISISQKDREVVAPLTATITRSCSTVYDYLVNSDGRFACTGAKSKYLIPSQSYPERLNLRSLRDHSSTSSSRRLTFHRRINVVDPAVTPAHCQNLSPVIRKYRMEEQACKCNSWPRIPISRRSAKSSDHQRDPKCPVQPSQQHFLSPSSDDDAEVDSRCTPPYRQQIGNNDIAQDLGSTCSLRSIQSHLSESVASSCCECPHVPYVKGVDGSVFKSRMEVYISWHALGIRCSVEDVLLSTQILTSWFAEFNDQQRNMMLMRLLVGHHIC